LEPGWQISLFWTNIPICNLLLSSRIDYLDDIATNASTDNKEEIIAISGIRVSSVEQWLEKANWDPFSDHFLRACVGHRRFDTDKRQSLLSKWVTISDEAFALLVIENNIDRWIDMYMRADRKNSAVLPKYTNGGKSQVRNGSSQRCKGWSIEGTKRYGDLYHYVKTKRSGISWQEFEKQYLVKTRAEYETDRALKKRRSNESDQDELFIPHSLWSDDEGNGDTAEMKEANSDDDSTGDTQISRRMVNEDRQSCDDQEEIESDDEYQT
jgi:hypothetical protein